MKSTLLLMGLLLAAPALAATPTVAPADSAAGKQAPLLPVEHYTLPNGLRVVFHIDRSDPVTAVVLAAHVGSARELPGRTGFAHMFEHLFFLDSENLGKGGLDKLSARVGGSGAGGYTNRDMTVYHQEVPNDALEKMLWAEADKLGYFVNTITEAVVAKEQQVVKNEKRQSVDNRPYGHTYEVILEALYPEGHPYRWRVIGSMADLDAATLADVQAFYRRWYVPNNATLVIAGDFDPAQARAWVEKYFGEIPRGADVKRPEPRPVTLAATRSLVIEDDFAQLPELTFVWPTVTAIHPDAWPIDALLALLTEGKDAPLRRTLVDELKLTSDVDGYQYSGELTGETFIGARGFDGVDLDRVKAGLEAGFARFEKDGVDPAALARVKTMQEKAWFGALESVEAKARLIAELDVYSGQPDFAETSLQRLRAVTADDVMRVYRKYFQGRPYVATSVVPKGKLPLALAGAEPAKVVKEPIVQGAEAEIPTDAAPATFTRTPSRFDRTVEPAAGPAPQVRVPTIWNATLPNGLAVSGIESRELPIVAFELSLDGGRLFDDPARPGASNLLARMLTRGTARRTPAELENALKSLGAEVTVVAEDERTLLSGSTLSRNVAETMALVQEMLLQPRWDAAELALAKSETTSEIQANLAEPEVIADRILRTVSYGPAHILSRDPLGSEASVAALTMDDLRALHARSVAPGIARLRVVGDVDERAALASLAGLASAWPARDAVAPVAAAAIVPTKAALYFYDIPDSKQSTLLIGAPSLRRADPDFYPATVMNYILGGGGFASRLTQQLREGKGYTYGIRSRFDGGRSIGMFELSSPVRANVTLEAATLIKDIVTNYGATFTAADLEVTKSFLTRSRARAFETPAARLGMLANIGDYGLPADYVARQGRMIEAMTVEGVRALAAKYLTPGQMTYVVVGDAATQAKRLEGLGLGPVVSADGLLDGTKAPE